MKQLTALEIIDETVAFYSADVSRRSFDEYPDEDQSICKYLSSNGNKCAVGRCMTDDSLTDNADTCSGVHGLSTRYNNIDRLLQEEYKGQKIDFWYRLQKLHDGCGNWDEKGITLEGIEKVHELKNLYTLENKHYVEN